MSNKDDQKNFRTRKEEAGFTQLRMWIKSHWKKPLLDKLEELEKEDG